MASTFASRPALLRRAMLLAAASIAWMLVAGGVAVTAGIATGSVALLGFGIDSLIELASAAVVAWRVRAEQQAGCASRIQRVERLASRWTGALLLSLALYLLVEGGLRLAGLGERAHDSPVGIAIALLSLAIMPLLARAKLRIAGAIGSDALRADAYESVCCAWLAATALAGLALNAAFGWSWADPLAALALVPLIAREGLAAWRGKGCGCKGSG